MTRCTINGMMTDYESWQHVIIAIWQRLSVWRQHITWGTVKDVQHVQRCSCLLIRHSRSITRLRQPSAALDNGRHGTKC